MTVCPNVACVTEGRGGGRRLYTGYPEGHMAEKVELPVFVFPPRLCNLVSRAFLLESGWMGYRK